MLEENPNKRAYYDTLLEAGKRGLLPKHMANTHVMLLSHPFFWSARRTASFLVALGNFRGRVVPTLSEAVRTALEDVDVGDWRQLFETDFGEQLQDPQYKPPAASNPQAQADHYLSLLRFIRNMRVHENDSSSRRKLIKSQPYFLQKLPKLAVCCWRAILKELPRLEEPSILEYLITTFDPELGGLAGQNSTDPWL